MVEIRTDSKNSGISQPDFDQKKRDFVKFGKNLGDVLSAFERAREWADLSNCLQKVKKTFMDHPGLPVPQKKELAKRLAQCLNPDLNVIHQLTLEVYDFVFDRELAMTSKENKEPKDKDMKDKEDFTVFGQDLALFFSGLFSFYQFAAFEVKKDFMKLIATKVILFKKELVLAFPGFLVCMLPALDEQNSELLKQIESILLKAEEIIGTSKFFGEIWKTIIRTPRARLAGFKYLDRRIPKDLETATKLANEKESRVHKSKYSLVVRDGKAQLEWWHPKGTFPQWALDEGNQLSFLQNSNQSTDYSQRKNAYFYFYYPNKETLVLNALLAGLQIGSLQQNYVNRATFDFLISHLQINGDYLNDKERIILVEGTLNTLPQKDFASLKKFFNWFQGHLNEDQQPKKEDPAIKAVIEALKNIMSKLMKAADTKQEEVVTDTSHQVQQQKGPHMTPITIILQLFSDDNFIGEPILQEISVDLIKFIKHYYGVLSIAQLQPFESRVYNLVDQIEKDGNKDSIWSALGYQISEEVRQVSSTTETRDIEAIDLITFFLQKLNKSKDKGDKQTQQSLDQMARQESIYNEQMLKEKKEHKQFLKMITPIFCCLLQGVESISNGMANTERTIPALDLIKEILDIMKVFQQQSQNYYAEDKSCHVPVKKFCQFYIKMLENSEQQFKKNGNVQNITAFNKASTIIYEIQRYVDPSDFNTLPKWLEEIIKLCERGKKHDTKILLIGIGVFLKIIENNKEDANMLKLQDLVRPSKSDSETNQKNYCMNIIQKLWSMLDEQSEHLQIVQLLKQFDLRLPRTFSSVVTSELANNKSREIKYKAVSKFAIFWKLTDKDYQTYKPFEPILFRQNNTKNLDNGSNIILDVVNSGSSMQDRQYIALQNMLGILDDQDPTLRLSCRSWLTESKDNFLRILDPLLKEFMDNNRVYKSFTGQVFFLEENYVPQNVIENFRKLRNIILNTQSEFIKYIVEKDISEHIRDQFDKQFDYINVPYLRKMVSDKELKYCKDKYIYAIICITLQFIIGQAVESLNSQLFAATQTVNASACEFMELVMKSIHNKVSLSTEITHLIIGFLVKALRQAIDSKNNAQQVHLINLIQAIVIDGNFYASPTQEKKEEQWCSAINKCANSLFIEDDLCECIVDGIKSNQPIVRYHYITLSDRIVQFMQMHIENKQEQLKFVQKIITCYCDLLLRADVKMYSLHFDKQARSHLQEIRSTVVSQNVDDSTRNVGNGQIKEKKQIVVITQENDIAQVIDGLRNIIAHCLEIKQEKEESEEGSNKPNREEQISAPKKGGLFGFFRGQKMDVTEMDRVKDGVFDKMLEIMVGVINCWNSTDVFKTRDHYFTRLGVFPWNREDDIAMKKQIREVSQKIQQKNDPGSVQKMFVRHFEKSEQDQTQENKITDEIQISQEAYLKEHFNVIQTSIVNLLKPIVKRAQYRDKVVHAFLKIWGYSAKFREIEMPVNEGCEKIIQILLSIGIPPDEMIESVQQYVIDQKWNVVKQPRDKPLDKDQKNQAMTQSLYCQFVYCYLLHCIHFNFETNFETSKKPDDFIEISNHKQQFERMYINMMKFFKCFIYSRSPVTINWLLEILNVLSSKFKSQDSGFDKKLKLEFEQVLDTLLNTATLIIIDQFGVTEYRETFGIQEISFSPTVYEMLKRYQYIKQKAGKEHFEEEKQKNIIAAIEEEKSRGKEFGIEIYDKNENLRFESQQLEKQDEIPMQKDSMFETINVVRFVEEISTNESLGKFMENFNRFLHNKEESLNDSTQRELFKVCTIVTLRQIMVNLVASIHNNDNKDGQNKSMSIVMQGVTSVISSHIKTLKTTSAKGQEKAKKHSDAVAEFLTEFIAYMASNKECTVLQKSYKAEINRMFNDENFFNLNERMLRHWQTITDNFIGQGEGDIFEEQLLKFNKMEGFFVNKNDVFQNKSLTFKRLAFLVFSAKNAGFQDEQLDNLLRKMTEGFKLQEKDYNMKQQLFLLSRILMLRLKASQLEDALRKLWPHLLNELVNVFDTYKASKESNEENIQLANQAMLIIELMSQLHIEDFLIDQWMFLFDGYGIEFKAVENKTDNNVENKTNFGVVDGKFDYRSQDVFQPYLVQFMCKNAKDDNLLKKSGSNQEMRFYKVDTYRNITPSLRHFTQKIQTSLQRRLTKAQAEANESRVEEEDAAQMDEDFIFRQVRLMQDKLAKRNTQRPEVARQNAEQLLEKEFIAKNDNIAKNDKKI